MDHLSKDPVTAFIQMTAIGMMLIVMYEVAFGKKKK